MYTAYIVVIVLELLIVSWHQQTIYI